MLKIFNRPPKYNSVFYPTETHHANTFVLKILQNILLTEQEGSFLQPTKYQDMPLLPFQRKTEITKDLHLKRTGKRPYTKRRVSAFSYSTTAIIIRTSQPSHLITVLHRQASIHSFMGPCYNLSPQSNELSNWWYD